MLGESVTVNMNYGTGESGDHASAANVFSVRFVTHEDGETTSRAVWDAGVSVGPDVAAEEGSRPGGYDMDVRLSHLCPKDSLCSVMVADQRGWSGCVDVRVVAPQGVVASSSVTDGKFSLDSGNGVFNARSGKVECDEGYSPADDDDEVACVSDSNPAADFFLAIFIICLLGCVAIGVLRWRRPDVYESRVAQPTSNAVRKAKAARAARSVASAGGTNVASPPQLPPKRF
jgi:hypothetical protein